MRTGLHEPQWFKQSDTTIKAEERASMQSEFSVVGIDLAKSICHLVGTDERGQIMLRKRLARGEVLPFRAQLPRGLVGMEACGGAHDWARPWREQGHEVQLLAPPYVQPYVQTHKHDLRDAAAIAEAVTRPSMGFGPSTNVAPQDLQALPRVRARLRGARTARVNARRGLWAAYGIVLPTGGNALRHAWAAQLEAAHTKLTPLSQELFGTRWAACKQVEAAVASDDEKLQALAPTHPESHRLLTMPGMGPLTATALIAAVGDGGGLTNGRQCAAW
jgi:transposase